MAHDTLCTISVDTKTGQQGNRKLYKVQKWLQLCRFIDIKKIMAFSVINFLCDSIPYRD